MKDIRPATADAIHSHSFRKSTGHLSSHSETGFKPSEDQQSGEFADILDIFRNFAEIQDIPISLYDPFDSVSHLSSTSNNRGSSDISLLRDGPGSPVGSGKVSIGNVSIATPSSEGPLTEFSSSGPGSVYDVPPTDSFLSYDKDGNVATGTLESLVERLIQDTSGMGLIQDNSVYKLIASTDYRKDCEYQEVFLSSYKAFTDAEQVFTLLSQAFNRVSSPRYDPALRASGRHG